MRRGAAVRPDWGRSLRAAGSLAAFAALPVLLLAGVLRVSLADGYPAWDFHHELYPQAELMLSGRNPYPPSDFDPLVGNNLVWPPVAAYLVAPLTLLPPVTADVVFALLGLVCFAAALWVVGVRDWRVFGVVALWPPVFMEVGLSHLTPVLALLTAAAWRARSTRHAGGLVVGLAIALKLFVWPLGVWLAAIGQRRAALLAVVLPAVSVLLVLPFTGLDDYLRALLRVGRAYDDDSYTVFGLLVQAGGPEVVARALTVVLAAALVVATVRYRSFSLAVATALVASPIVWLDYFALAAVPLAVARPRLSPVWLVPLVTVGLEGAGWQIGDVWGTLRVLGAFTVVLAVAFREEQAEARRTTGNAKSAPARLRRLGHGVLAPSPPHGAER